MDPNHNSYRSYIHSLSNEDVINWFFSILRQYPVKEILPEGSDLPTNRSAVVFIKANLHSFQSLEYRILELIAGEFPTILFVVSVDDVIAGPSDNSLLVGCS